MSSLLEFLGDHRSGDGLITHTSKIPAGKYYISSGDDLNRFFYLYQGALSLGQKVSILELQDTNYCPILVDVDLKVEYSPNSSSNALYSLDHVRNMVKCYMRVLRNVIPNLKDDDLFCLLMEKKGYIEEKNHRKYLKNGFHIHFPNILLTRRQQEFLLTPLVKKEMKENKLDLPYGVNYNNWIDDSVMKGKGKPWFLYGSRKTMDTEPYLCSRIFLPDGGENENWMESMATIYRKSISWIQGNLPKIFSVRLLQEKKEYIYEIDANDEDVSIDEEEEIIVASSNEGPVKERSGLDWTTTEWVDDLLSLLPLSYAFEYDSWKRIGWILYNIYEGNDEGFFKWDAFSQKCSEKYDSENLRKEWNKMEMRDVTIGSLKHIIQTECPEEYTELLEKYTTGFYKSSAQSSCTTHHDIARLLYLKYESQFRCASVKNNLWFEFTNHTWKEIDDGVTLRNKISTEVVEQYEKLKVEIISKQKTNNLNHISMKKRDLDKMKNDLVSEERYCEQLQNEEQQRRKSESRIAYLNKEMHRIEKEISDLEKKTCSPEADEETTSKRASPTERVQKIINNLKSTPFKKNVMMEARDMFYDENFSRKLDTNPWLIAFNNGVFDLKEKTFRDGCPNDYISLRMHVQYRKNFHLDHPQVKMVEDFFIKIFPDKTIRQFFLEANSEIFVGKNQQKWIQFWSGNGDNGKSITEKLFEQLLGPYCVKLPTSLLTGKRTQSSAASPELIRAGSGARMVMIQEPTKNDVMNTGVLKELSGNDTFYARGLYKEAVEINPMFKLVMICNEPPKIENSQSDQATWNRIRVIPFESYFPADDSKVPTTFKEQLEKKIFPRDRYFEDKIPDMLEGLAFLLLDIYCKRDGSQKICEPHKVLTATESYRKRNDVYRLFMEEKIVEKPNAKITFVELYDNFKDWYRDSFPNMSVPNGPEIKEYLIKSWGKPEKGQCAWANRQLRHDILYDEQ